MLQLSSKLGGIDYQETEVHQGEVLFDLRESKDSDRDSESEEQKKQNENLQTPGHLSLEALLNQGFISEDEYNY